MYKYKELDFLFRRSASRLASSVCGGRVRSISTVVNRPSLVHNPCPLRPFVSYSTAAVDDDWIRSEQVALREINSEFNDPVVVKTNDPMDFFSFYIWNNRSIPMETPPASFPFKIEDIPGNRTVTFTREYNGEHIKVEVSMPPPSNESSDDDDQEGDDDDDAPPPPSNESNDDDDQEDDDHHHHHIPLVVTVTKKSGRSLELRCEAYSDDKLVLNNQISIGDMHVNLPGHSSEDPKVIRDMDSAVGMGHEDLKETLTKYLKIRGLEASTLGFMNSYMVDKMKHEYWLWLGNVKEFLEE